VKLNLSPDLAFVVGVLGTELVQFGIWWSAQPKGGRGRAAVADYWSEHFGYLCVIAGAGTLFCLLWSMDGLDWLAKYLPEALTQGKGEGTGVPYTPQAGIFYGALLALRPDRIVSAVSGLFSRGASTLPAPPAPPGP